MRTVAVPALGGAGCSHRVAHAVNARGVILAFLIVTTSTVGRRHVFIVDQFLDPVMAIDAVQELWTDLAKPLVGKSAIGLGVTVDRALIGRIGMAVEAVGVCEFLNGIGRCC